MQKNIPLLICLDLWYYPRKEVVIMQIACIYMRILRGCNYILKQFNFFVAFHEETSNPPEPKTDREDVSEHFCSRHHPADQCEDDNKYDYETDINAVHYSSIVKYKFYTIYAIYIYAIYNFCNL